MQIFRKVKQKNHRPSARGLHVSIGISERIKRLTFSNILFSFQFRSEIISQWKIYAVFRPSVCVVHTFEAVQNPFEF